MDPSLRKRLPFKLLIMSSWVGMVYFEGHFSKTLHGVLCNIKLKGLVWRCQKKKRKKITLKFYCSFVTSITWVEVLTCLHGPWEHENILPCMVPAFCLQFVRIKSCANLLLLWTPHRCVHVRIVCEWFRGKTKDKIKLALLFVVQASASVGWQSLERCT